MNADLLDGEHGSFYRNAGNINAGLLGTTFGGTGVDGSAAANGTLLIGNGTGYTLTTLSGTTNQVSVANAAGSITLSTPQDIHSGASPTFAGLTLGTGNISSVAAITGSGNWSTSGNISSTGTGTITSAGLLTASAGLTVSSGAVVLSTASIAASGTGVGSQAVNLSVAVNFVSGANPGSAQVQFAATGVAGQVVTIANTSGSNILIVNATAAGVTNISPNNTRKFVSDGSFWYPTE
ncbi:MAG: hypothetical protein IPP14_15250 [Planctomycetes bacterium]|nr:hypothetical protein [Planctomycetota bacterium]